MQFAELPDKTYQILLIDPPWSWDSWSKKWAQEHKETRWVGKHYDVMPANDIAELPVANLADKNCTLFLWTTFPNLNKAFDVIKAWGFTYKTVAFVWVKKNKKADSFFTGLGFWTRSNAEICLLAVKGSPHRVSRSVHQVIYSPVREHSRKPDEARERIVELMGDLPRIELFAREKVSGWASWGLEVGCNE